MKRGVTHIEVVFSFLIFVTVIGFSYFYFQPFKVSTINEWNINAVEASVIESLTEQISIYGIYIENECGQAEYSFDPETACSQTGERSVGTIAFNLGLTDEEISKGIKAFSRDGTELEARFGNSEEDAETYIEWTSENGEIIYIIIAEGF